MIKLAFQKVKIGMNKTHLADGLRCEWVGLVLTELQIYKTSEWLLDLNMGDFTSNLAKLELSLI